MSPTVVQLLRTEIETLLEAKLPSTPSVFGDSLAFDLPDGTLITLRLLEKLSAHFGTEKVSIVTSDYEGPYSPLTPGNGYTPTRITVQQCRLHPLLGV